MHDSEAWPGPRSRHGGVDEVPLTGLAGRLWLCGKHYVGPDPDAALAAVGATTVVCLNQRHELADRYPGYVDWLTANTPDRAVWHPVPDLGAPPLDDALALLGELQRRLTEGEGLLLHCGAGIGRAGTIATALLVVSGVQLTEAAQIVASSRPLAGPEAGAQADLLAALGEVTLP